MSASVFNALIVDDERLARINLKRLLVPYEDIKIVGEADSCSGALPILAEENPNLIFLDIQLTGECGFDLLPEIQADPYPAIIFVTAYDEYAVRAFEINALDYLLKPVNPERLKKAVERLRKSGLNEDSDKDQGSNNYDYSDTLFLKTDFKTSQFVQVASIYAITPVGNHTEILLQDGSKCVVLKTLKQWLAELPEEHFLRIHKSMIINKNHVVKVERTTCGRNILFMKGLSESFPVSRRYFRELKRDL